MTFAFGLGGPVANFAALLHMTVHSLTKSSIFFTAGHASQRPARSRWRTSAALLRISPTVGWGLMLGSLAILGMPPFGVFASEFLILTTAMREHPWATPFLLIALGVAFAGHLRASAGHGVWGQRRAPCRTLRRCCRCSFIWHRADAGTLHSALRWRSGIAPRRG